MFEYMQTDLNGYDIPSFLEDWHQLQLHHLNKDADMEWMRGAMQGQCKENGRCEFMRRHGRDREKDFFDVDDKEIDLKNIILNDAMDSIHSLLFHPVSRPRNRQKIQKHKKKQNILSQVESIEQCNVDQIIYILDEYVFDKLNPKTLDKLEDHRQGICDCIKENDINGNKLKQMKRKEFVDAIADKLKNKKLRMALAAMYKAMMEYEFKQQKEKHIDLPDSIDKYNVEQIIYILDEHIIDKLKPKVLDKLKDHKQTIIDYIEENEIDGNKLTKIGRLKFMKQISAHLGDNKLRYFLGKLYEAMMEHDLLKKSKKESEDIKCPYDVDKLVSISEYIIESALVELEPHKVNLIDYLKKHSVDGKMLFDAQSEELCIDICKYLQSKRPMTNLAMLKQSIKDLRYHILESMKPLIDEEFDALSAYKSNKFSTEVKKKKDNESKAQYYSFGTQYKYTRSQIGNPLFVAPKFANLKEELYEYFKRVNAKDDAQKLIRKQLKTIDAMDCNFRPLLKQFVCNESVTILDANVLWMDDGDDEEHKYDQFVSIITAEHASCERLQHMLTDICVNSESSIQIETNIVFNSLFIKKYTKMLEENLSQTVGILFDLSNAMMVLHGTKKYNRTKITKLLSTATNAILHAVSRNNEFAKKKEHRVIIEKIVDKHAFILQNRMKRNILMLNNIPNFDIELNKLLRDTINELVKLFIYFDDIRPKLQKYPTLHREALKWVPTEASSAIPNEAKRNKKDQISIMIEMFDEKERNELDVQQIGHDFIHYATQNITKSLVKNKELFIDEQQQKRCNVFIEKAENIVQMESVKQMKASCYQGINDNHGIGVGQSISIDHVLALILYAQCTKLCTKFRQTYRRINISEYNVDQIIALITEHILDEDLKTLVQANPSIIEYIQRNGLDGTEIKKLEKHKFAQEIIVDLNKILQPLFVRLYDNAIASDITAIRKRFKNEQEIWSNNPKSISECSHDQIGFILGTCIKQINDNRLVAHLQEILAWIDGNKIDGAKLNKMNHAEFANDIIAHLIESKFRPMLESVHQSIINHKETEQEQKIRHSYFGHTGRLLYEAFVFYGSRKSQVKWLYHGMTVELIFTTLYCTFNAPTSTTTEEAVASSFGENGVILEFESADSNEYIKTFDMCMFTCYPNEREHLIFESRLHIKDIWVPRLGCWVGKKIISALSLLDLLIHGNAIHENKLMTKKNQKKLYKRI